MSRSPITKIDFASPEFLSFGPTLHFRIKNGADAPRDMFDESGMMNGSAFRILTHHGLRTASLPAQEELPQANAIWTHDAKLGTTVRIHQEAAYNGHDKRARTGYEALTLTEFAEADHDRTHGVHAITICAHEQLFARLSHHFIDETFSARVIENRGLFLALGAVHAMVADLSRARLFTSTGLRCEVLADGTGMVVGQGQFPESKPEFRLTRFGADGTHKRYYVPIEKKRMRVLDLPLSKRNLPNHLAWDNPDSVPTRAIFAYRVPGKADFEITYETPGFEGIKNDTDFDPRPIRVRSKTQGLISITQRTKPGKDFFPFFKQVYERAYLLLYPTASDGRK